MCFNDKVPPPYSGMGPLPNRPVKHGKQSRGRAALPLPSTAPITYSVHGPVFHLSLTASQSQQPQFDGFSSPHGRGNFNSRTGSRANFRGHHSFSGGQPSHHYAPSGFSTDRGSPAQHRRGRRGGRGAGRGQGLGDDGDKGHGAVGHSHHINGGVMNDAGDDELPTYEEAIAAHAHGNGSGTQHGDGAFEDNVWLGQNEHGPHFGDAHHGWNSFVRGPGRAGRGRGGFHRGF